MPTGVVRRIGPLDKVLAFPGVFRGALDSGATNITEAMKVACVREIADLAEGLKKYQQQLQSVKTNKEYGALLNEIDGKTHNGEHARVPNIFGMNFQSVSTAEKLPVSDGLKGGYLADGEAISFGSEALDVAGLGRIDPRGLSLAPRGGKRGAGPPLEPDESAEIGIESVLDAVSGEEVELTDAEFEQEVAQRRQALHLQPGQTAIGCPQCALSRTSCASITSGASPMRCKMRAT